jgi:hypothetical protein
MCEWNASLQARSEAHPLNVSVRKLSVQQNRLATCLLGTLILSFVWLKMERRPCCCAQV